MTSAPRSVLIVEDEMMIAMDLQMQLEGAGWRVIGPVGSLEEAERLVDERPDAALLDVNLGQDTSFELARGLVDQGTRVIFLTGKTRGTLPEGMEDVTVVQKPLRRDQLTQLLNGATGA